MLLIALIVVIVLATLVVVIMLCYFKNKKDKHWRVKGDNVAMNQTMGLPDTSIVVDQTIDN